VTSRHRFVATRRDIGSVSINRGTGQVPERDEGHMRRQRIDYGQLVEAALRTVVRDVLRQFAAGEVPPPHHFYVTFSTRHPGVEIPDYLHARYPSDMTIVLQHQFWDLDVGDDGFGVTLSFNDQPERLIVPFEALRVFADPGVEFGLQFTLGNEGNGDAAESAPLPLAAKTGAKPRPVSDGDGPKDSADQGDGAEIVTLDRFRKK
jgi:uncharacterized protein